MILLQRLKTGSGFIRCTECAFADLLRPCGHGHGTIAEYATEIYEISGLVPVVL